MGIRRTGIAALTFVSSATVIFLLAQRNEKPTEWTTIFVAKERIEIGTFIKNPGELFESRAIIAKDESNGAVHDLEVIKGWRVNRTLDRNEILVKDDLLEPISIGE